MSFTDKSCKYVYTLILIVLIQHTFTITVNPSATQNFVFPECLIPPNSRWLDFTVKEKAYQLLDMMCCERHGG